MGLLELPLVTAITSALTLVVTVWIGFSLERHHSHDHYGVPLRARLLHPTTPPDKLREQCAASDDVEDRGEGE